MRYFHLCPLILQLNAPNGYLRGVLEESWLKKVI